jgi:hypothetical protein
LKGRDFEMRRRRICPPRRGRPQAATGVKHNFSLDLFPCRALADFIQQLQHLA